MDLSYDKIKKLYRKKNYKHSTGTYHLNIFGIRELCGEKDIFNDFKDDLCVKKVDRYQYATDQEAVYNSWT